MSGWKRRERRRKNAPYIEPDTISTAHGQSIHTKRPGCSGINGSEFATTNISLWEQKAECEGEYWQEGVRCLDVCVLLLVRCFAILQAIAGTLHMQDLFRPAR